MAEDNLELMDSVRQFVEVARGVAEISSKMDGCEHAVIATALDSAVADLDEQLAKTDT